MKRSNGFEIDPWPMSAPAFSILILLTLDCAQDEINRQVDARKKNNPLAQRQKTILEITSLISSRNLALRRGDRDQADEINRQIISLGADPTTGQLVTLNANDAADNATDYDARIQKINENNKRKTKENMAAAHAAALQRKKVEEAIVRSRQWVLVKSCILLYWLIRGRANSNSPAPVVIPKPAIPPASGLKKGETPQQYVARTIDLDLGDF